MITFSKTYDKVTAESAEHGEAAERGYFGFGGWFYDMENPSVQEDIKEHPELYAEPWTPGDSSFREHIQWAQDFGVAVPSCDGLCNDGHECWWSTTDGYADFRTGDVTYYSLHVGGVTPSTRRRIHRLLRGENVFGR